MQGNKQRKFTFCPTLANYEISHLIVECADCHRLFAACCLHQSFGSDWYQSGEGRCCHLYQLAFTDGACSNNGWDGAKAGMGIIIGSDIEQHSWSIPVDDAVDPGAARTNQSAELLAVIEGLKKLEEALLSRHVPTTANPKVCLLTSTVIGRLFSSALRRATQW
jgi:ribonuclease HI